MKLILVAAIVVAGACGANRTPRGRVAPAPCAGRGYAVVTNDWDRSVDLYGVVPPTTAARVLASVGSGDRQTIVLPNGARNLSLRARDQGQISEVPREYQELARMRITCETSQID